MIILKMEKIVGIIEKQRWLKLFLNQIALQSGFNKLLNIKDNFYKLNYNLNSNTLVSEGMFMVANK